MNRSVSNESPLYSKYGASSSKAGVHAAVGEQPKEFFVELGEDVCGSSEHYSLIHADGAGTKSIVAYLAFRETGDPKYFRSLAQDALVMNLDDVACVNAFESLYLSNTIGRNRSVIPDEVISELIEGYREFCETLRNLGVPITLGGGETADLGDLVRTLVVDSTLFARVRRDRAINCRAICPGDKIVGLSSTGQAVYETKPNSGIASNGLTLARHACIDQIYAERYPEVLDPHLPAEESYRGKGDFLDESQELGMSLAEALLSPTRSYAPIVRKVCEELRQDIHGVFHLTGGAQSKPIRFGSNRRYIKDQLFPCPPIFQRIQKSLSVPWQEMYTVFNMGHRIELVCPESAVQAVIDIASEFSVEAKTIGYVEEESEGNVVEVRSEYGKFEYRL